LLLIERFTRFARVAAGSHHDSRQDGGVTTFRTNSKDAGGRKVKNN